jgi:hypothetical protein
MRPGLSDRSASRFLDGPFELNGWFPAGRDVAPLRVVEVGDPCRGLQPRLGAGGEGVPVGVLDLEDRVERLLRGGVVQGGADSPSIAPRSSGLKIAEVGDQVADGQVIAGGGRLPESLGRTPCSCRMIGSPRASPALPCGPS